MEHEPQDLPLSRIVDRIDGPKDWQCLHRAASADATVYAELLDLLEQDAELRAATASVRTVADRVELPRRPARTPSHVARNILYGPLFGVAGWLAAAVLAFFWLGDRAVGKEPATERGMAMPGMFGAKAPGDDGQLPAYPMDGQAIVGSFHELPPILVRAEPTEGGGYDVVWMRRTIEEATVPALFGVAYDEYGDATAVPFQGHRPGSSRDF